jgi:isoleucyl-tRNA synthetase
LSNLDGFNPATDIVKPGELLDLDRWVINQTLQIQDEIIVAYDDFQFHQIYQKLHHYCVVVLGNFYLDIIKDRIYTTKVNSMARRSSQTALYYIAESFVRWIAPILSFTADEIWQHIPGERSDSVFLEDWYQSIPKLDNHDNDSWATIIAVRDETSKVLERLRMDGLIGSSLDAEVSIYCKGETLKSLASLNEELRFVFITSNATLHEVDDKPDNVVCTEIEDVWIKADVSVHDKCIRCWHHREDVGKDTNHPEICLRCVENVEGAGEVRRHV